MKILLIVYDNGSHIPFFPQGIAYLTAALQEKGHQVSIWMQDMHHKPETYLIELLSGGGYDLVGLGFVAGYWQYRKAKKIAEAVNKSTYRSAFKFVLGGHGPAAAPEYFMDLLEADAVFVGEADKTLPAYADGKLTASDNIFDATMWGAVDPDATPWPAYDMFPIEAYRLIRWPTSTPEDFCMPILSGRGCPYKCTFCYRMQDGHFKPRDPEHVIEEMLFLHDGYGINHFQFSDELFMSSKKRVFEFCDAILAHDVASQIPGFKWDCNGRLNHAGFKTLKLMKRAGCEYVNYGIEAIDNGVLKNIKKGLMVQAIHEGVNNTLEAGLVPGLNLIWGSPGDDLDTLKRAEEFLLRYDTCKELRTIRPVTPYPGSQMYYDAINDGLIEGPEDFYEYHHVNSDLLTINQTGLADDEFHAALSKANRRLIRNYYNKKCWQAEESARELYSGENDFRGFREV